jgi:peroxiredoxin Q/BCP
MNKRAITASLGILVLTAAAGALRAQSQTPNAGSAPLAAGTPAPNAPILVNGKKVAFQHLLAGNRNLILFYPAACTSCDGQLQAVDKGTIQELDKMGFATFAVSPDLPADQAKTVKRLSLPYVVVSDPDGAAAKAFHVSGSAAFLIETDGTIRFSADLDRGPLRGSDLIAAARALKRPARAKR